MDVNAAYDEVANAFWLEARKVGPAPFGHYQGESTPPS